MLALEAILLYALYNVFYIASSLYLGKRSDFLGRNFGQYLAGFVLYGVGIGAFLLAAFAYVGDLAKAKGTAMGAFQSVYGIAVLLSSTVFGYLLGMLGATAFLIYTAIPILAVLMV